MTVTAIIVSALTALGLAATRLWRGPSQADRVIALDVALAAGIALAAAAALATGQPLLLDVAIGVAMVGFVGTIAWARLIDHVARRREP